MLEQTIELLKERGYEICDNDKIVPFLLQRVTDKALNYCHLKKVPEKMEGCIIDMCVAAYIQSRTVNTASVNLQEGVGAVTSIKDGDIQTNFDSGSANTTLINAYINHALKEFKRELNAFRKLGW